ncbi:claudin-15 isoform X3 [Canis lupus familiaris]|uniref:claudin-15 isoform X3 n=1 Tax=Canis lupus familiaris TaxID=9615 RepID=UPI000DC66562|nr:claudin-15 isoform X3 [Canis lupus familiaris]XP_038395133.1 claudin-15 isoform X3 [Canis lupus familiaris]XP_038523917.1 claudin-15 isoform X3 [Canis lupus familiaris]
MSVAVETFGFFMAALGLLMLGVTLPNSYWRVSTVHGSVITTNTIFENLWFSCATDSLGVYSCREFPSLLALSDQKWPSSCDSWASAAPCWLLREKAQFRLPRAVPGTRHGGAALHKHWGHGALQEGQAGGHRRGPTHTGWILRDGGHLLVRLQHHPGILRPFVSGDQVRAGPRPLPGLERLPSRHPGRRLPRLRLLPRSRRDPGPQAPLRCLRGAVPRPR